MYIIYMSLISLFHVFPYFPFLSITGIIPFLSAPLDRFLQLLQNTENIPMLQTISILCPTVCTRSWTLGAIKKNKRQLWVPTACENNKTSTLSCVCLFVFMCITDFPSCENLFENATRWLGQKVCHLMLPVVTGLQFLHNFSGQPLPLPHHHYSKQFLPYI